MRFLYILTICFAFLIAGCGGGGGGGGDGASNNTPVISGTPTTYQKEGTYSFTPSATDADSDSMTWSITNKPGWANFDTSTGKLSGAATAGIYEGITITVSDGTETDSVAFDLTVVTWVLTKTGQTICWDSSGTPLSLAECLLSKQDGEYQKGSSPYFIRTQPVAGEYIVTDYLNGLMWQDNSDVSVNTYTYADAVTACSNLASSTYAGYSDWRVPTVNEIHSIAYFGRYSPAITPVFVNTVTTYTWTSSPVYGDPGLMWAANYSDGGENIRLDTDLLYLRCVRGDSYPSADFIRNSTSGIVTDKRTGLMWQDDAVSSTMTWSDAIDYCEDKTLGGYSDWRLPNVRELSSIADVSTNNPAINAVFVNTQLGTTNFYWSSSTYELNPTYEWGVTFYRGVPNMKLKSDTYYARCVRGVQ